MPLTKKNLEREITQAIAARLATSRQLSDNVLNIIARCSEKLAGQLHGQFEKETKILQK